MKDNQFFGFFWNLGTLNGMGDLMFQEGKKRSF